MAQIYVQNWKIELVREHTKKYGKIRNNQNVASYFQFLEHEPVEVFCAAFLNSKLEVIGSLPL